MRARPFALTSAIALVAACSSGYRVDDSEYCRRRPADLFCVGPAGGAGASAGAGGASSSGAVTLYVLTTQGRQLKAWRKGPDDEAPFLLGEVTAKAAPYFATGNPFGAAYVLTDAQYVYFADVGTVDTSPEVDVSQGDGVVYRVAK